MMLLETPAVSIKDLARKTALTPLLRHTICMDLAAVIDFISDKNIRLRIIKRDNVFVVGGRGKLGDIRWCSQVRGRVQDCHFEKDDTRYMAPEVKPIPSPLAPMP